MNSSEKKKLYFAAPLFNGMERQFNKDLANMLRQYFDVYLPQEDGGLMADMIKNGMKPEKAAIEVFHADIQAVTNSDILLIILDGRTVDEGASFELGFAYALGKPCFGLQTDDRHLLTTGNNPMLENSLHHVFQDVSELLAWAARYSISVDYSTAKIN